MVSGETDINPAYDVTGDRQVTQADIDFLTRVVSGVNTDYTPPPGSFLGPTGLYGQLATNEAQRQADLASAQRQREADLLEAQRQKEIEQAAAKEAQRQAAIKTTLGQGQQQLQQIAKQVPQALQMAQTTTTPIYGEMGPYLDLGSPLDFDFFKPSPEKQAATKQQQPTKIATGGYIDDLLAGDMTVDDLLNLLR
jgi:multidrug efflux pump subunit AcrA (membrane-fusion protein)